MEIQLYKYQLITDSTTNESFYQIPAKDLRVMVLESTNEINHAYGTGVCLGVIFGIVVMLLINSVKNNIHGLNRKG